MSVKHTKKKIVRNNPGRLKADPKPVISVKVAAGAVGAEVDQIAEIMSLQLDRKKAICRVRLLGTGEVYDVDLWDITHMHIQDGSSSLTKQFSTGPANMRPEQKRQQTVTELQACVEAMSNPDTFTDRLAFVVRSLQDILKMHDVP